MSTEVDFKNGHKHQHECNSRKVSQVLKSDKKKDKKANLGPVLYETVEGKRFENKNLPIHDQPVSSLNKDVTFTVNQLRRAFGFRNITQLLPHIKQCSQETFSILTQDEEPFIDLGQTATIDKSRKNTTSLNLPTHFGHTIHVDLLFRASTAHGDAKYATYFVDRATRYKMIYPLQNLTTDIIDKFKQQTRDLGFTPKRHISDCDKKLFSTDIKTKWSCREIMAHHFKNGTWLDSIINASATILAVRISESSSNIELHTVQSLQ